ncbi:MAG: acylphosphatase [Alphaproteobacteria bacterium]|nr:acylphosphatase [Alphaproteobacteria bacterium]
MNTTTSDNQDATAAAAPRETVRVFVHGFVQGVSYRRWLQGEALEREIHGWVRNRADGSVEALLHGEAHAVDDLLRACRHGPMMARVDKVHSEPAEYDGLESFRIESTV